MFLALLYAAWVVSAQEAYRWINVVVQNRSGESLKFGMNEWVRGEKREVFFRGSFQPFPLPAGETMYLGTDPSRTRLTGFYLERAGKPELVPCSAGFHHYRLEVTKQGARCIETRSAVDRWLANLPSSFGVFAEYRRGIWELLTG